MNTTMNTTENTTIKFTDAAGTPIAGGDKVIWSPKSSTQGTPRKGIVMGIGNTTDWRGDICPTVTVAVITGGNKSWGGRTIRHRVAQRVYRFKAANTGEYRHLQCLKADYVLTEEEKKGIRYRQIHISASSIFAV
jgi:hypothetical protein